MLLNLLILVLILLLQRCHFMLFLFSTSITSIVGPSTLSLLLSNSTWKEEKSAWGYCIIYIPFAFVAWFQSHLSCVITLHYGLQSSIFVGSASVKHFPSTLLHPCQLRKYKFFLFVKLLSTTQWYAVVVKQKFGLVYGGLGSSPQLLQEHMTWCRISNSLQIYLQTFTFKKLLSAWGIQ